MGSPYLDIFLLKPFEPPRLYLNSKGEMLKSLNGGMHFSDLQFMVNLVGLRSRYFKIIVGQWL